MHYCVTNMPGIVPHTSTYALTNATLSYALALADPARRRRCASSPALQRARTRSTATSPTPAVAAALGTSAVDPADPARDLGDDPDAELAQLRCVDGRRRVGQRADALSASSGRRSPRGSSSAPASSITRRSRPEGEAAVRRRAVRQRLEQEAELRLRLRLATCRAAPKTRCLQRPGDGCGCCRRRARCRSAPGRRPARAPRSGSRLEPLEVLVARRRERMVHGDVAAGVARRVLDEREVDDPEEAIARRARSRRAARRGGRGAATRIASRTPRGSASRNRTSPAREPGRGAQSARALASREELGDRRLPAVRARCGSRRGPCAPSAMANADEVVELLARQPRRRPARAAPRTGSPAAIASREHAELGAREARREVGQLERRSAGPGGRCRSGASPRRSDMTRERTRRRAGRARR